MSERKWQAQVERLARKCGWLTYHTFDSRRSAAGFPDLVLVRGSRTVFAELKSATGVVSPEQREWLQRLTAAGQAVYTWRPADWPEVVQVLTTR